MAQGHANSRARYCIHVCVGRAVSLGIIVPSAAASNSALENSAKENPREKSCTREISILRLQVKQQYFKLFNSLLVVFFIKSCLKMRSQQSLMVSMGLAAIAIPTPYYYMVKFGCVLKSRLDLISCLKSIAARTRTTFSCS